MKNKIRHMAGFLMVFLYGGLTAIATEEASLQVVVRPVLTAKVEPLIQEREHVLPGKVRAVDRVELAFMVPGLVGEINILEGERVEKGAVLAMLDSRDYRYACEAAEARCLAAQHNFERTEVLWKQQVISRSEYDSAEAGYAVLKAELAICRKALADTKLLAPFEGLVARRYVEKGEQIKKGERVLSLQNIARIEVVLQLSERLIARVGVNGLQNIQVCFDADPERWFVADVYESSIESNPETRTYSVGVALDPPSHLQILPGMTATVHFAVIDAEVLGSDEGKMRVPVESILYGSDGTAYVWRIDPEGGAAKKQRVTVGAMHGNGIEVLSGLCLGELVAVEGLHSLCEGMNVRPMRTDKEGLEG